MLALIPIQDPIIIAIAILALGVLAYGAVRVKKSKTDSDKS